MKQSLLVTGMGVAKLKVTCSSVPALVSGTCSYAGYMLIFVTAVIDISNTNSVRLHIDFILQIQMQPKLMTSTSAVGFTERNGVQRWYKSQGEHHA